MIGWFIAWAVSYFIGAGWTFLASLVLAVFAPRLTQFLFATVVFPVYTLFFGTWAFVIGWMLDWHIFCLDAWRTCISWTAVPVGLATWYFAREVRELGIDRLRGD